MSDLTKPRCDAWDASLDEAARWRIYAQSRRAPWYEVAEWIAAEYHIEAPSRSALYAWIARMRRMESAHRLEQAVQAREEIGAMAGTAAANDRLIAAYKSMAAELALKGNAADAVRYTTMAMAIGEAQRKSAEVELKARAQETKDAQLRLAREKFEAAERRLSDAKDAVANSSLTPAERDARLREIFGL